MGLTTNRICQTSAARNSLLSIASFRSRLEGQVLLRAPGLLFQCENPVAKPIFCPFYCVRRKPFLFALEWGGEGGGCQISEGFSLSKGWVRTTDGWIDGEVER